MLPLMFPCLAKETLTRGHIYDLHTLDLLDGRCFGSFSFCEVTQEMFLTCFNIYFLTGTVTTCQYGTT